MPEKNGPDFDNPGMTPQLYEGPVAYTLDTQKHSVKIGATDLDSIETTRITNESSPESQQAFVEQRQHMAEMENAMMDASVLITAEGVDPAVKAELRAYLQSIGKSIQTLVAKMPKLKETYAYIFKAQKRQLEPHRPSLTVAPEVVLPVDLAREAKQHVQDFLFGGEGSSGTPRINIKENTTTQKLEISSYRYIPDPGGNPHLDREEVVPLGWRGNVDWQPDSGVRRKYPDLDKLCLALKPILEREVASILPSLSTEPLAKATRAKIEACCANKTANVLYTLDSAFDSKSLVTDISLEGPDKSGIVEAVMLRREQGVGKKKADRLHLPETAYLDRKRVEPQDLSDPQLRADLSDLHGSGVSEAELMGLYAPLPDYALRALEGLLDDEGNVVSLVSRDQIMALFDVSSGAPHQSKNTLLDQISKDVADIVILKEKRKHQADVDLKSTLDRQQNGLYQEIRSFLAKLNPPASRLEDVVARKGRLGLGGVTNQADVEAREDFERRQTELSEQQRVVSERLKAYKPQTVYGSQDEGQVMAGIQRQLDRAVTLTYKAGSLPIILDQDLFKGVTSEPMETLVDRLREKLDQQAQKIASTVAAETAATIDKLTQDFARTKALLERVMETPDQSRMQEAVLAYIQGRMYNFSDDRLSMYKPEQRIFYYAGQRSRATAARWSVSSVPENIRERVRLFDVLPQDAV